MSQNNQNQNQTSIEIVQATRFGWQYANAGLRVLRDEAGVRVGVDGELHDYSPDESSLVFANFCSLLIAANIEVAIAQR